METIFAMFPTIGAIAVICFLLGEALKLTTLPTKTVPVLVALAGGVLGVAGHFGGVLDLVNITLMDAIATGIVSGLVASGGYSLVKNLAGAYPENDLSKTEQKQLNG